MPRSPSPTSRRWLPIALSVLALGTVARADDAVAWLKRLDHALATRNYRGTFVHEHGGQSETLRIVHRSGEGSEAERVVSLDGSGREFIRRNGELTAYFPDRRLVLVERAPQDGLLLNELTRLDDASTRVYRMVEEPVARVSGRTAHVVVVEPLDDMRYGYRVWIDEASGMPLKTQLRDANGKIVEQLVFTELSLPERIGDAELQPAVSSEGFQWVRHDAVPPPDASATACSQWQVRGLPPGFRLTANARQVLAGEGKVVTHLVFSDGLASVSVFCESQTQLDAARASGNVPLAEGGGEARVGTTSAVMTTVNGHRVTAIGEVPPATVRAIAGSIQPAASAGPPRPPAARRH